jgi:hypothetical protein
MDVHRMLKQLTKTVHEPVLNEEMTITQGTDQ